MVDHRLYQKPHDLEDFYQFSWAHKKIHFPLFSVDRWFVAQQIVHTVEQAPVRFCYWLSMAMVRLAGGRVRQAISILDSFTSGC